MCSSHTWSCRVERLHACLRSSQILCAKTTSPEVLGQTVQSQAKVQLHCTPPIRLDVMCPQSAINQDSNYQDAADMDFHLTKSVQWSPSCEVLLRGDTAWCGRC